jgi:hypothetical protein
MLYIFMSSEGWSEELTTYKEGTMQDCVRHSAHELLSWFLLLKPS